MLANTDRWADRSVLSRDLIDLAFLASHWGPIPPKALVIVEKAYGVSILRSLQRAVLQLESGDSYRQHCIVAMGIADTERLKDGLTALTGKYPSSIGSFLYVFPSSSLFVCCLSSYLFAYPLASNL